MLLPTAMPIEAPLPEAKQRNIETYLRTGRKHGNYA